FNSKLELINCRRKDFKKEHYMRTELIRIPTPSHPLDSAYYTPEGPIKGAVMYCHGNQMNFYVCAARFLAPYITSLGYVFLAFNRRGHDSVSTFDSREPVGGAYQTVAEGVEDNDLAAQFLAEQGFKAPVVIGHSKRWGAGERTCRAPSGDASFDPAIRSRGGKPSDKSPIGAELHHQRENRGTNKRSGSVGRSWQTAAADAHPDLVVGDFGANISGSAHQRPGSRG